MRVLAGDLGVQRGFGGAGGDLGGAKGDGVIWGYWEVLGEVRGSPKFTHTHPQTARLTVRRRRRRSCRR